MVFVFVRLSYQNLRQEKRRSLWTNYGICYPWIVPLKKGWPAASKYGIGWKRNCRMRLPKILRSDLVAGWSDLREWKCVLPLPMNWESAFILLILVAVLYKWINFIR